MESPSGGAVAPVASCGTDPATHRGGATPPSVPSQRHHYLPSGQSGGVGRHPAEGPPGATSGLRGLPLENALALVSSKSSLDKYRFLLYNLTIKVLPGSP